MGQNHLFLGSIIFFVALMPGCASMRGPVDKPASTALSPATDTPSARYIQSELEKHPSDISGFRLLSLSTNALLSRITLADHAEKSIDLQYYIFKNDATGRLVAQHLLIAADRGVRVRLLLDDLNLEEQRSMLDAFDSHPNIEVRLFNPFKTREPSIPSKIVQVMLEASRLNRRMHNKSFIVDNKIAVIGGRNIGDDYFDASVDTNFRDLDLVAIGPVVIDASRSFDDYWNSDAAFPVSAYPGSDNKHEDLKQQRLSLAKDARRFAESDYAEAAFNELPDGATADRRGQWFWGKAILVADAPEKVEGEKPSESLVLVPTLDSMISASKSDLLLMSPYFIPSDSNVEHLAALSKRGVSVNILTNSLAATDELAVYAKYAPHRKPLLEAGVNIFELRPAPGSGIPQSHPGQSSGVSLHAKAFVIDGRFTYVGSMNLDPRSKLLNTEMGLVVDNEGLAKAVKAFFDTAVLPANSYRLLLSTDAKPGKQRLLWSTTNKGVETLMDDEPDTTAGQRLKMRLMKLLPVDGLL